MTKRMGGLFIVWAVLLMGGAASAHHNMSGLMTSMIALR